MPARLARPARCGGLRSLRSLSGLLLAALVAALVGSGCGEGSAPTDSPPPRAITARPGLSLLPAPGTPVAGGAGRPAGSTLAAGSGGSPSTHAPFPGGPVDPDALRAGWLGPTRAIPAPLREALAPLAGGTRVEIATGDWSEVTPGDGARARARVFTAGAPLRPDLPLGTLWLEHQGRPTASRVRDAAEAQVSVVVPDFADEAGAAIFSFDMDTDRLQVLAAGPPGDVAYGYTRDATLATAHLERLLTFDGGPATEVLPFGRLTLHDVSRPSLLMPVGTRISCQVIPTMVDTLRLSLGVPGAVPSLPPVPEDHGVRVTLTAHRHGRLELWSGEVRPRDGFVDVVVPLGELSRERVLSLGLEAEALVGGEPALLALGALAFEGEVRRPHPAPHVVLVDVDTLRADRLGCYGYPRDTSPRLDAWAAARACVFEDAQATNSWTLPSTVSILTGRLPGHHGVLDSSQAMTGDHLPLPRLLREAGYETLGRSDGGYIRSHFGFDLGFDRFERKRLPPAAHQREGWDAELERLAGRRSERPVFLFLQTYQVHAPLRHDDRFDDPAAPYDGPLVGRRISPQDIVGRHGEGEFLDDRDWAYVQALYDAGVRRMDDVLGRLLDDLETLWADEPFLLIVTSDHGEELADRGGFGHGHSLHRELLEVPLIVRPPDPRSPLVGARVARTVSSLDVVPTALDAAGLNPLAEALGLPGRSLLRPLGEAPRLIIAEQGGDVRAAIEGEWKLMIDGGFGHLYHRGDDPEERESVGTAHTDVVERLLGDTVRHLEATRPEGLPAASMSTLDPETVAELKALGYLGDG